MTKPKMTVPKSLKGGGKPPKPKGYVGDNSSKKLPMPSANASGKGTVGKASIAASPKVPTRPTSRAGGAGAGVKAGGSPPSRSARMARLSKAVL
jgi:hypothetical protein